MERLSKKRKTGKSVRRSWYYADDYKLVAQDQISKIDSQGVKYGAPQGILSGRPVVQLTESALYRRRKALASARSWYYADDYKLVAQDQISKIVRQGVKQGTLQGVLSDRQVVLLTENRLHARRRALSASRSWYYADDCKPVPPHLTDEINQKRTKKGTLQGVQSGRKVVLLTNTQLYKRRWALASGRSWYYADDYKLVAQDQVGKIVTQGVKYSTPQGVLSGRNVVLLTSQAASKRLETLASGRSWYYADDYKPVAQDHISKIVKQGVKYGTTQGSLSDRRVVLLAPQAASKRLRTLESARSWYYADDCKLVAQDQISKIVQQGYKRGTPQGILSNRQVIKLTEDAAKKRQKSRLRTLFMQCYQYALQGRCWYYKDGVTPVDACAISKISIQTIKQGTPQGILLGKQVVQLTSDAAEKCRRDGLDSGSGNQSSNNISNSIRKQLR